MSHAESLGKISQLLVPSPCSELISRYEKRGYEEIDRLPMEEFYSPEHLKETGFEMILMQKQ